MNQKNNDSLIQDAKTLIEDEVDEKDSEDSQANFKNMCSWLLIFTPEELVIVAGIFAILITKNLTLEEQAVVASFLVNIGDSMFLITAQAVLIQRALEEQTSIQNLQKQKIIKETRKAKEEIQIKINKQTQEEIRLLKEQVKELQDLLNKQLH